MSAALGEQGEIKIKLQLEIQVHRYKGGICSDGGVRTLEREPDGNGKREVMTLQAPLGNGTTQRWDW